MGLSPAATLTATTLVAVGVAYYYLLRKRPAAKPEPAPAPNEPHDTTDPPTATCPPTASEPGLASTRSGNQRAQSVVSSVVRPASRWTVGGTAIGAYEEFSANPVPSPSTTATATTTTNSTAFAASDAALLATLASPVTAASTAKALACLAARVKAPAAGDEPMDLEAFLRLHEAGCALLDVRSPAEFEAGHIPGAFSLPLFTDDERAAVGTCYKQQSREAAMAMGMGRVGPKLKEMVARARSLAGGGGGGGGGPCRVAVYCWRGGMRSGAVAWLLRQHGIEVCVLGGGYKTFRGWALGTWGDISMPVPKAKQKLKKQPKPRPPPKRVPGDAASSGADAAATATAAADAAATATAAADAAAAATAAAAAAATAAAAAAAATAAEEEVSSGGLSASLVEAAQAVPGRRVCVVGGRTGVGKTRVLMALRQMGARWLTL